MCKARAPKEETNKEILEGSERNQATLEGLKLGQEIFLKNIKIFLHSVSRRLKCAAVNFEH